MSGTSADGVTAVIISVDFDLNNPRQLFFRNYAYSRQLREEVLNSNYRNFDDVVTLDWKLGNFFAWCVQRAIRESGIVPDVIGVHGQTIFHSPRSNPPFTKQIGNQDVLCFRTGITVVCDFRSADIVRHGQGAPLIPVFDRALFNSTSGIATLNLGGISNVTILDKKNTIAFDTGPCNCIIDAAAREFCGCEMDRNGVLSGSGVASLDVAAQILDDDYFSLKPPKSLDASYFRKKFLDVCRHRRLNGPDAVATAVFVAAAAVRRSMLSYATPAKIIASGGGVFNETLLRILRGMLAPAKLESISNYGWHPIAKEGGAIAFLALKTLFGKISNVSEFTGAVSDSVLGKIVPGKNYPTLLKKLCR